MPAVRDRPSPLLRPARLLSGGAALAAEFDRFFEDLKTELGRMAATPFRMRPLPEVFGVSSVVTNAPAAFGRVALVDPTAGDVNVLLPEPQNDDAGCWLGVRRGSTANVVTLVAPSTSTIGGISTLALPTTQRVYLVYYEGRRQGYSVLNDA